jgi:hypothetical protein
MKLSRNESTPWFVGEPGMKDSSIPENLMGKKDL